MSVLCLCVCSYVRKLCILSKTKNVISRKTAQKLRTSRTEGPLQISAIGGCPVGLIMVALARKGRPNNLDLSFTSECREWRLKIATQCKAVESVCCVIKIT